MSSSNIEARKADHIALVLAGNAEFRKRTTLLECVQLVHQSLPELAWDDIDLRCSFLGKELQAPLLITGMTGGTQEATCINQELAEVAQEMGIAFGLGSQRAMAEAPELTPTYQVRNVAPDVLLLGNIGAVQAVRYGCERVAQLAHTIGADAMAVHLNPAQEMIQRHGDRDFRGVLACLQELAQYLKKHVDIPLIVKETGCGISRQAAQALRAVGVEHVDVSGAGGTSWVAVETQRAPSQSLEEKLGNEFWDWGIPTAVSVQACVDTQLQVVASGGIRTGLDVARAIALGASLAGVAAPVLRAHQEGGKQAAKAYLEQVVQALRTSMLLTGSRTLQDLQQAPRCIEAPLSSWRL